MTTDKVTTRLETDQADGGTDLQARVVGLEEQVRHLQVALESARDIGMAMGIIMARLNCVPDEAFAVMRQASQSRQVKLRQIAAEVVFSGALPEVAPKHRDAATPPHRSDGAAGLADQA